MSSEDDDLGLLDLGSQAISSSGTIFSKCSDAAIDNLELHAYPDSNDYLKAVLAAWAVDCQVPLSTSTALLKILRRNGHPDLPSDGRTLLSTPRSTLLREVQPGAYWHAGLENAIISCFTNRKYSTNDLSTIELAISIDGLPLSRSSGSSLWPILGSIIPFRDVFVIGAYHGLSKPANSNDFLNDFVSEVKELSQS